MDGGVGLIFLSGIMLIGSFMAGSIPIVMQMSEDRMHFISVMGAGLLVGTALTVIIPEGIRTLHLGQIQQLNLRKSSNPVSTANSLGFHNDVHAAPQRLEPHHDHGEEVDAFASVGLALVLGFCFMLLVDQCSRHTSSRDVENSGTTAPKRSFTATLGLVVHAAADGIALGAAATTPHPDVEMIVFVAIMLHKAPASFGLVTFLLHEGLDRKSVRRHLAVFCLAAPIMAMVTYFGISQEGKEDTSTMQATAFAMLFSAGTFLYVATVHVLPEVTKDAENGFTRRELVSLVAGLLLPLLLTWGHRH